MNTIIIDGRLTEHPVKQMIGPQGQEEKAVCNFRIAHTANRKNSQTGEYDTFFIDVTAWRNQAEYLCSGKIEKGDLILIQGAYEVREWQDRYSGKKRTRGQIIANSIQLMQKKAAHEGAKETAPEYVPEEEEEMEEGSVPLTPLEGEDAPAAIEMDMPISDEADDYGSFVF